MKPQDPVVIQKNRLEEYHLVWDTYQNTLYLALKVVKVFRKKDQPTQYRHKNLITIGSIDLTKPDSLQRRQAREMQEKWKEISRAVTELLQLKNIPKPKIEF